MPVKACSGMATFMNEKYPLTTLTVEVKEISRDSATIQVSFGCPDIPKALEYDEIIMRKGDVYQIKCEDRAMIKWVIK